MRADSRIPAQESDMPSGDHRVYQTTCCIVGGGPAGAVLALLLSRKGIDVMLLEARADFNRDFRGDTLHPSSMEIMDQVGLADRLLELPHSKISQMTANGPTGSIVVADFSHLRTRFPYITMMPQTEFLTFITGEAARTGHSTLLMSANVNELIEEDGVVRGVRFLGRHGRGEVRALLTVGADGRFSRLRRLGGFTAITTSPPMDIVWFRIPRLPGDPSGGMGRFSQGRAIIALERTDHWQMGFVIPKGGYHDIKAAGLDALRASISGLLPVYADRIATLDDWKDFSLLSVESDRLTRWYKPGLLLIGDAAHVMSPVGGNGINYAIQDAVVAANELAASLKVGQVTIADLARVQRKREWAIRIIQGIVTTLQKNLIANALKPDAPPITIPFFMRWPVLREIPARLFGYGIGHARVK